MQNEAFECQICPNNEDGSFNFYSCGGIPAVEILNWSSFLPSFRAIGPTSIPPPRPIIITGRYIAHHLSQIVEDILFQMISCGAFMNAKCAV